MATISIGLRTMLVRVTGVMLLAGVMTVSFAARTVPQCPSHIAETELKLVAGPAGWTAYNPANIPLRAAGFMAGPPASKTELKPDSSRENKTSVTEVWKFDRGFFADPDGLWLSCAYGEKQELTLSKKISSEFVECSVTYAGKTADGYRDIRAACH